MGMKRATALASQGSAKVEGQLDLEQQPMNRRTQLWVNHELCQIGRAHV